MPKVPSPLTLKSPVKPLLGSLKGSKLLLSVKLWGRKPGEAFLTGRHAGKPVAFTRLPEARDFATRSGYTGIRLTTESN